jgi:uncharacterized protein YjbI with pentapeptide repeats
MFRSFALVAVVFTGTTLVAPALDSVPSSPSEERQEVRMQFLSKEDFSGKDLGFTRFFRARMNGANFTGANLSKVTFEQTDLAGADFTNSVFSPESKFYRVNMNGADFQGVDVAGAEFDSVNLRGSDFRNSTGWTKLRACNFAGADFRGADLSSADFCDDCVLKGTIIDNTTKLPEKFNAKELGMISSKE